MTAPGPSIVVVGGGLAGAAFLLHLLRDHGGHAARLAVIEPRAALGAGLAYSTTDPVHRINVAAARMSVLPEEPDDFDAWLRRKGVPERDPAACVPEVGLFPQRAEFARYVGERLRAAAAAAPGMSFRHRRSRVRAIRRERAGFRVTLDDGTALPADVVVLATGHNPPGLPPALRELAADPRLVADPADLADLARPPAGEVLVLGTGLTGCDAVASLRQHGWTGRILAVSRHGLLPRPRTRLPVAEAGDFARLPPSAVALLRRARVEIARQSAQGQPWENVIAALREQAPAVWPALPVAERQRALRHLRAFWDVHRFQCAPQISALLRREIAAEGLELLAARLVSAQAEADAVRVRLRPRGAPEGELLERRVALVVNCTGPDHAQTVATNPALRSLQEEGALQPDPCRLGIAVDGAGRALDAKGAPQDDLLVAGPPARGGYGELIGMPQMTNQPRQLAARVAAGFLQAAQSGTGSARWL